MANAAMGRELEELRAQVAQLTRSRDQETSEQEARSDGSQDETTGNTAEQQGTDGLMAEDIDENEITSHLQELVEALEEGIKESNPMTLLLFLVLGIVIGRLLPTR